MRFSLCLALLACGLALAACGQSKEDKAKDQVCEARSDIQKQLKDLQGVTVSSASLNQIQKSFSAIGNDVQKIADAQGDLKGQRKQEIQSANATFASAVQDAVKSIASSTTRGSVQASFQSAVQQLQQSYRQALAPIDC